MDDISNLYLMITKARRRRKLSFSSWRNGIILPETMAPMKPDETYDVRRLRTVDERRAEVTLLTD